MVPRLHHPLARHLTIVMVGVGVMALSVAHLLTGLGGGVFAHWYQPTVFTTCGLVVLARAARVTHERSGWALLGSGLVVYGCGSVVFNLAYSNGEVAPFPSIVDVLWLGMYPAAFAAMAVLARRRFARVTGVIWLDGLICGGVVAAVVAAVAFEPIFDVTVAGGAASVARLGYPVGDLVCMGFVVGVWSLSGRRFEPFWLLLGAGFALLAFADGLYVVEAAHGTWAPGNALDLPYALATMLLAGAAWMAPRRTSARAEPETGRYVLPVTFAGLALVVLAVAELLEINALAGSLAYLTVAAVALRFAVTLRSLNRQRDQLAELAATDPLTGVANHRTLHQRLEEELHRAQRVGTPLAVVALDIDHFKVLNDTFGHAEGDTVLQMIAGALRREVRAFDLVARVGGEEFALVLPGADGCRAHEIAERCRVAILDLELHGVSINCSAGVAAFPEDDGDGRRLLELADGALYAAKQQGRAQVRRYDPRTMVLLSSAEQHRQVRGVLERPEALTPVFQPIVELATGRVAGFEALTRFLDVEPVRTPDLWFAQARRCGLGNQLEALAITRALSVEGRPPGTFLTLNVSPAGLLSREVQSALPHDLSDLVIELTEDELFSTDVALDLALADLRARGARIAVDDAGAGYAGLPQLVRIKPDILKLDRALIQDVHDDGAKTALLEALSRFAASTGAAVCAEGIEKADELRALARLDVSYAQGYALGRPGPPWPPINDAVVGVATAPTHAGMRVASFESCPDARPSLADVTEALARVDSPEGLNRVVPLLTAFANADEIALSRVADDELSVETLSRHTWGPSGQRYWFRDFPATERVVRDQVVGQIVSGDDVADGAELALLRDAGHAAVLMLPIVHRARTVGLLELYRTAPRPWTPTETEQVRMLAHHLGASVAELVPATSAS